MAVAYRPRPDLNRRRTPLIGRRPQPTELRVACFWPADRQTDRNYHGKINYANRGAWCIKAARRAKLGRERRTNQSVSVSSAHVAGVRVTSARPSSTAGGLDTYWCAVSSLGDALREPVAAGARPHTPGWADSVTPDLIDDLAHGGALPVPPTLNALLVFAAVPEHSSGDEACVGRFGIM